MRLVPVGCRTAPVQPAYTSAFVSVRAARPHKPPFCRTTHRPALIQELPPPSPTGSSPAGSPRHHAHAQRQTEQQQQQCGSSGGGLRPLSPLDSAYARGDTPSLPPSSPSGGQLGSMAEEGSDGEEEASSSDGALAGLHQRRRQHGAGGGSGGGVPAGPADDLDSDSLLHARREGGGKPAAAAPGGGYPWLPAVTREVLTVRRPPLLVDQATDASLYARRRASTVCRVVIVPSSRLPAWRCV